MRYVSMCIPKQMRLQPLPENVGIKRQVSEVVRQRVPGHRTGDGEHPMSTSSPTGKGSLLKLNDKVYSNCTSSSYLDSE